MVFWFFFPFIVKVTNIDDAVENDEDNNSGNVPSITAGTRSGFARTFAAAVSVSRLVLLLLCPRFTSLCSFQASHVQQEAHHLRTKTKLGEDEKDDEQIIKILPGSRRG